MLPGHSSGRTILYVQQLVYVTLKIMELFKITYLHIYLLTYSMVQSPS